MKQETKKVAYIMPLTVAALALIYGVLCYWQLSASITIFCVLSSLTSSRLKHYSEIIAALFVIIVALLGLGEATLLLLSKTNLVIIPQSYALKTTYVIASGCISAFAMYLVCITIVAFANKKEW